MGAEKSPKDAHDLAGLSVWDLKKALHICIVDVAAMRDIIVIVLEAAFRKVRNID